MDPALLLQRQKFAKHMAASTESALEAARQAKAAAAQASAGQAPPHQPPQQQAVQQPQYQQHHQHHHPGQGVRFNALSRIIRYMKTRHIEGMRHPLSLEEILEETKQEELPQAVKVWLGQEALPQNPKLVATEVGAVRKFQFKPIYQFRSGRSGVKDLLRLLRQFDQESKGGVLKEDVEEGLGTVDDAIKQLGHRVTVLTRMSDKKVTLFHNDPDLQLPVDEEFKKIWRSCPVQSLDEQQMQQYLSGQGISTADAQRPVGFIPAGRGGHRGAGSGSRRQKPIKLRDNEHMNHVLQDFSDAAKK